MEKVRYGDGSYSSMCFASRIALVQRYINFLRATMPATICGISLWISGSPPGMETMGAPHSSTARSASSTLTRFCRISFG